MKSGFADSTSLYTRPFPPLALRRQMAPLNHLQAGNQTSSTKIGKRPISSVVLLWGTHKQTGHCAEDFNLAEFLERHGECVH